MVRQVGHGAGLFPNPGRPGLALKSLVDFGRQDEVAFGEPVDLVGPGGDVHFAPGQAQVGMMAFLLGDGAGAIYEIERRLEIREQEPLRKVMLLHYSPAGQLRGKTVQLLPFERRHSSAAGHAMSGSKIFGGHI